MFLHLLHFFAPRRLFRDASVFAKKLPYLNPPWSDTWSQIAEGKKSFPKGSKKMNPLQTNHIHKVWQNARTGATAHPPNKWAPKFVNTNGGS